MGVVITGKFTIKSPVTIEELKSDWSSEDVAEVLAKESEALTKEFSAILGLDYLNESDNSSAELKVHVAEEV
jgi:hypothetical protein